MEATAAESQAMYRGILLGHGLVTGELKFKPNVEPGQLIQFANEWLLKDSLSLIHLYIRKSDDGRHCIGFQYRDIHDEKAYKALVHKIRDKLYRRFGMDFCGWDISSTSWVAGPHYPF